MTPRDVLTGIVDALPWEECDEDPTTADPDEGQFDDDLPDDRDPADYGSTRHV